jgi:hypothetical protein
MTKRKINKEERNLKLLPPIIAFFLSIIGLLPLIEIFSNPSEKASQLIWGLSAGRLLLVGAILIIMGGNAVAGVIMLKRESKFRDTLTTWIKSHKKTIIDVLLVGAVGFSWLTFIGNHNFGSNQSYYIHLKPLLTYIAEINLAWLFGAIVINFRSKRLITVNNAQLRRLIGPAIIIVIFALTWLFIDFTGIGVTPKYPFWGNSGTILFGYQLIVAFLVAATVALGLKMVQIPQDSLASKWLEIGVFILLWGVAAITWIQTEPNHNFFAPTSGNQIYYPYSDAAIYDTAAQSILIGEGFSNPSYTTRPMYISFLSVFHFISGQDYLVLIAIQAGLLAIAIPFLYLIGKRLHSRFLGMLMALLGLFLEMNAITTPTTLRVSHSKLIMTEYPTAVLLIIAAYYSIVWFQEPKRRKRLFFVVVGFLVLSMLIRLHTFVVLFGLLVLIFIFERTANNLEKLKHVLIAGVFIMLILSPWMLRNYIAVGQFSLDPGRFDLLMENRWQFNSENFNSEPGALNKPRGVLLSERPANPSGTGGLILINEVSEYVVEFVAHFLHNEALLVLALPSSYNVFESQDYYQSEYYLFENWSGNLTLNEQVFLSINLIILAVGITAAYQRNKFIGLVPLLFQVLYLTTDSLVRTSGWRYIKPIEWVTLLYFAFGIIKLTLILRNVFQSKTSNFHQKGKDPIGSNSNLNWKDIYKYGFGFIFAAIVFSFGPLLIPQKYSSMFLEEKVNASKNLIQEETQFTAEDVRGFLTNPDSIVSVGRMLYPRFLWSDETLHHKSELPFYYLGINRIEFELLTQKVTPVFFPTNYFPEILDHAKDVVVYGCSGEKAGIHFIEAVLIIVSDEDTHEFILQDEMEELTCPVTRLEPGN